MRNSLDLTRTHFDMADFGEAILFFDAPRALPTSLSLEVWGVTLVDYAAMSKSRYVAGFSTLELEGVSGGHIQMALYETERRPPGGFVLNPDGSRFQLRRDWPNSNGAGTFPYEFNCCFGWPYGSGHLSLLASGAMTLHYNPEDCIPVAQYCRNPSEFSWWPPQQVGTR